MSSHILPPGELLSLQNSHLILLGQNYMKKKINMITVDIHVWKVRKGTPMQKCLEPMQLNWLQEEVQIYVSLWENDPPAHMIYYLNKQFSNELMDH